MKKLLSIFVLFFAFSLSANAQTAKKQESPEQKAKQDTFELTKVIEVDGEMQHALFQLFLKKHNELNGTSKLSEDGQKELANIIDMKLKATLTAEQIKSLQSNGLYEKLIH